MGLAIWARIAAVVLFATFLMWIYDRGREMERRAAERGTVELERANANDRDDIAGCDADSRIDELVTGRMCSDDR